MVALLPHSPIIYNAFQNWALKGQHMFSQHLAHYKGDDVTKVCLARKCINEQFWTIVYKDSGDTAWHWICTNPHPANYSVGPDQELECRLGEDPWHLLCPCISPAQPLVCVRGPCLISWSITFFKKNVFINF